METGKYKQQAESTSSRYHQTRERLGLHIQRAFGGLLIEEHDVPAENHYDVRLDSFPESRKVLVYPELRTMLKKAGFSLFKRNKEESHFIFENTLTNEIIDLTVLYSPEIGRLNISMDRYH